MDDQFLTLLAATVLITLAFVVMPRAMVVTNAAIRGLICRCRRGLSARRSLRPATTLHCSPWPLAVSWWQEVEIDGEPATLLVSDWQVTNTWDRPVHIEAAVLRKPRTAARLLKAVSVAVRHPETHLFGDYALPPGRSVAVAAKIWLQPPVCLERAPFTAGIAFIDSFGHEHPAGDLSFLPFADPAVAHALALSAVAVVTGQARASDQERPIPANRARRYVRAKVNLQTELWTRRGGYPVRRDGRSTVLGMGGAFIEVREGLPLGSLVRMRLRWQDLSDVVCNAIVRSVVEPGGVGVEFLDLSIADRSRIGALVLAEARTLQS